MSSIEKLVKAFEALKVLHTPIDKPEEAFISTKLIKKECNLTKKDKIAYCSVIADTICSPQMRSIEDFQKFLGISIETFLVCCDDNDSDIRLTANECLNRTIKTLLDSHLTRIQVELYKEIKKNGPSRSLRAALSRFGDLCFLIKPSKCRPYVNNLFPYLVAISRRTEEDSIQETLGTAMTKIMPTLGKFAQDNEIITLLNAFIPNLQFVLASVRRTAATSLVAITQHSKKPLTFSLWLLNSLLHSCSNISDENQETSDRVILGALLCFKYLLPHLADISTTHNIISTKFQGNSMKQKEKLSDDINTLTEYMLNIYELSLRILHSNTNNTLIVTALETLQQLLKSCPEFLLLHLINPSGIQKSRIDSCMKSFYPMSPFVSKEDKSLLNSQISQENLADLEYEEELFVNSSPINKLTEKIGLPTENSQEIIDSNATSENEDAASEYGPSLARSFDSLSEPISPSTVQSTPTKNKSTNLKVMQLTYMEKDESVESPPITPNIPNLNEYFLYKEGNIGEYTTAGVSSLEYCTRVLCSKFLLTGFKHGLVPDKEVRVSIKTLALSCMTHVLRYSPRCFLLDLHLEEQPTDSVQKIWDIIQFFDHNDPHLRGQVASIIGTFLHEVLKCPNGYNNFLLQNCSLTAFSEAPSLENLIHLYLMKILNDKTNSSISIRSGLMALNICINSMLKSTEPVNIYALQILLDIITIKQHNYWLVRVELLELLSKLPMRVVKYLELSNEVSNFRKKSLQDIILHDVIISLLGDDDFRVRKDAAKSLIRFANNLYIPSENDDGDPVISLASSLSAKNLKGFADSNISLHSSKGQFPNFRFLRQHGFLISSNLSMDHHENISENNLKTIIDAVKHHFMLNFENKNFVNGCCMALAQISETFPPSDYPNAWGIDSSSANGIMDFLQVLYTFLMTPAYILDLNLHQHFLILLGNLLICSFHQTLKMNISVELTAENESENDWGIIADKVPYLIPIFEKFTYHLLKILRVFSSVIDDVNLPVKDSALSKPSLVHSLPNSSLSPIRKKNKKIAVNESEKNDKKTNEKDKVKGLAGLNISSDPMIMKFYDLIKSTYNSYKLSMDLSKNKLLTLIEKSLVILSQLLEIGNLKFFGKFAEEILDNLKIIITLEPTCTILCVRQLLKCTFGTNLCGLFSTNLNEENKSFNEEKMSKNPHKNSSFTSHTKFGLYQTCIAVPYTQFSQFNAAKLTGQLSPPSNSITEEEIYWLSFFRKNTDKRVNSILENSTLAQPNSSNSKLTLTSHIRLFEPIVIKALKLFTISSDIQFQSQVLDLLSHLVKLRVNYCLLDSDQVFIGFVQRQLEFIEGNEISDTYSLIFHIFNFLVLLSYERHQSKPIIGVPKIIQMCDVLMASGQPPERCVIPALIPVIEDLFLLRNTSKVDSVKELEAQREVAFAALLKLANFPQIIELLLSIVIQSRKDCEEKWKKLSRQLIDVVLPLLAKQQIFIDDYNSLDIIHRLFESVSPTVFRPLDVLLNALFSSPQPDMLENRCNFQRWFGMVIIIMRVIVVQCKEEILLSRLDEIKPSLIPSEKIGIPVMSIAGDSVSPFLVHSFGSSLIKTDISPEEVFSEYLLHVVQISIDQLKKYSATQYKDTECQYLMEQLSNYLLCLTYIFQSGSFRRITKSAMNLVKLKNLIHFDVNTANSMFSSMELRNPCLVLQWCHVLMLLGFDDNASHGFWHKLVKSTTVTTSSPIKYNEKTQGVNKFKYETNISSPYIEIITRGTLIFLCDFICENMNDAEQMTWLIVNNIKEIIQLSFELPIRDFIHAVHRNAASSGLFIQAINARCNDLSNPIFIQRLLSCIDYVHASQSGSLTTLLTEHILGNPQCKGLLTLCNKAADMAYNRLQLLVNSDLTYDDLCAQLSIEDAEKLVKIVEGKYIKLHSSLVAYQQLIEDLSPPKLTLDSHPLLATEIDQHSTKSAKNLFLTIISGFCTYKPFHYECLMPILNKLSYDELFSLLTNEKFDLNILGNCIEAGCALHALSRNSNPSFVGVINRNILLKASVQALLQNIGRVYESLPQQHQPFLPYLEVAAPKEAKYRSKFIDLFSDECFVDLILALDIGYINLLKYIHETKRYINSSDSAKIIFRFGILNVELGNWATEKGQIHTLSRILKVLVFFCGSDFINDQFHNQAYTSYVCSLIAGVFSIVNFVDNIPHELNIPTHFSSSETINPDRKHVYKACLRIAELLRWLEAQNEKSTIKHTIFSDDLRFIISSLSRLAIFNSFVLVPPLIWKDEIWKISFSGNFETICSTIPADYLRELDILKQFIFRIELLGWTTRIQFEEIWMSLLGVLSIIQNEEASIDEDKIDKTITSCFAVKGITLLLLHSSLIPTAGNPVKSKFIQLKYVKPSAFFSTKYGEKLQKIRNSIKKLMNIENELKFNSKYTFGQVSVEFLRRSLSTTSQTQISPSISSGSSSTSSSSVHSPVSPPTFKAKETIINIADQIVKRENLEIDLNSCIYFLLDLFGEIISSSQVSSPLLVEISHSLILLSDLFFEKHQFEWMLETFLELHKIALSAEDELLLQYIPHGICKSLAILGSDQDIVIEKCRKTIELALKSSYLPTRINTLYGLMYLLEQKNILPSGKESLFLPIISDYLLKHLADDGIPSSKNEEHVCLMWTLVFHLIEHFFEAFSDSDFAQKIFQLSLYVLSNHSNFNIKKCVVDGLERLLLTEVFTIKEADILVKIALEKFKTSTSTFDTIGVFRIIITSIYIYGLSIGNDTNNDNEPSEELLAAMEKIGLIFDKLKYCTPSEALIICSVLPHLLCEFFPTQDVLNKVIGEFLSNQQSHPQHLAHLLFQVLGHLHQESKMEDIHDWVVLSLSSFTQLEPMSHAMWALEVFLVSASSDPWIRGLFPCIQERFGKSEPIDYEILCCVASHFRYELNEQRHKEAFENVFEKLDIPGSPWSEVLQTLKSEKITL